MIFNSKGITLIEVMIAMVIFGFIAVPIFALFTGTFFHIMSFGDRSIATSLASDTIETLYAMQDEKDGLSKVDVEGAMDSEGFQRESCQDLEELSAGNGQKYFCMEYVNAAKPEEGMMVTIKVFFEDGKNVTLTSYIRGE